MMHYRGGYVIVLIAVLVLLPISAWCSLYEITYDFSTSDAQKWEYMAPGWSPTNRLNPDPAQFPYGGYNFYSFGTVYGSTTDWWYPEGYTAAGMTLPAIRFPRDGEDWNEGFEGDPGDEDFLSTDYLPYVNRQDDINFVQYHVIKATMRSDTPNWARANAKISFFIGVGPNRYRYVLEDFGPDNPWKDFTFDLETGAVSDWWQFSWDPTNPVLTPFQQSFLVNPDEFGWFITADPAQSAAPSGDIYMGFFSADVPAPPALLLLPIGLAGAMVARRRRREQTD